MANAALLAELFDLEFGDFDDDLPFYEALAKRGDGAVLELGVGTGRVAIPLAEAGFEVWGIDDSKAMLERARCKAERLHLEVGDMREFDLGRTFDLIYAGLGTFHHLLTREDQLSCLRSAERHLESDGVFVCDLRPFLFNDWDPSDSTPLFHEWTGALESGETVVMQRAVHADGAEQVQHETHIYDIVDADGATKRIIHEIDLRFSTRYEMEGLLQEAGLFVDGVYGDYDLAPFDDSSEYMITMARKAKKA